MEEMEIVRRGQIPGTALFVDTVEYRTAHFHQEWELLWILENEMLLTLNGRTFPVKPGNLVLLPPNLPHELRKTQNGCTFLCLQMSPTVFPVPEYTVTEDYLVDRYLDPVPVRQELARAADSYFSRRMFHELETFSRISGLLFRILHQIPCHFITAEEAKNRKQRIARLIRLQKFVDENHMHKLCLRDFAQAEGCTVSYLSHFVRDCLNQTFQEYVNTVRFHSACRQIAQGGKKMLDVCMDSGFSDYRYFSRAFRRFCGMTPEQYARNPKNVFSENSAVQRSLYSLERIYTPEESVECLQRLGYLPQSGCAQTVAFSKNTDDSKIV